MSEKGTGFVRRVTVENLESFKPLLRTKTPGGSGPTLGSPEVAAVPPPDPLRQEAEGLFKGSPIRAKFPFTPTSPTRPTPSRRTPARGRPKSRYPDDAGWMPVWEKAGLTERDLNIPHTAGTHPTGSMTLGKGNWKMHDFRHYFRDDVFPELAWRPLGPRECATASVELIVDRRFEGEFEMTVIHDPRTNTKSYKQKNASSHLRWNTARPLVARRELLGRDLRLFRKTAEPNRFRIEIG
jgi:hypothetical protein